MNRCHYLLVSVVVISLFPNVAILHILQHRVETIAMMVDSFTSVT